MADHPNTAIYRGFVEAFNAGDIEALSEYIADDVEWWYIGGKEPIRGKQKLAEMSVGFSGTEIRADVHDVIANDEHVLALVEATGTRDGRTLSYRTAEIHHVKDGKITERWSFSDDTAAIIDFFA